MREPISIKLPVYEGPLDLLLELIKKNEMNIYDIPMVEITNQYLNYLNKMKELDLEVAGEFLVMAATLIYIKSKMLLPLETLEEEELEEDPRQELVKKLLEYQAFKQAAKQLGLLEEQRGKIFTRQITDYYLQDIESTGSLDEFSNNLYDLLQAFHKVLKSIARESFHEVREEQISIEEKIGELKILLKEKKELSFQSLFRKGVSRQELIVTFLAVLEIVRLKIARIFQDKKFGDILIKQLS